MSTLKQMRARVKRLVRDDALILTDPGDYDLCLSRALQTYSLLRPRCLSQDLTVDSNHLVLASAITGFDRAYIEKLTIEYPIALTYGKPQYLDRDEWFLYQSSDGLAIRFNSPPQVEQAMRITHAGPHVIPIDENGDPDENGSLTILASDEDAIACEAAGNANEMLSNYYTQTADSSTGADFVQFTTKSKEYANRAKMRHDTFTKHMTDSLSMNRGSFQVVRS